MNIQEHLSAFDRWLTSRIDEAQSGCKDLAFRDLAIDLPPGKAPWEYSLLEPGARSPLGDGWSIYRLHGVWPETSAHDLCGTRSFDATGRRTFIGMITEALFGKETASR
jgi:hypothetical protein